MKKAIIISTIITLTMCVCLAIVPKHELPTDEEWEAFLACEEEFFEWRDNVAPSECTYQIQHRDTHEVYFWGTLEDCKNVIKEYELTKGECVIMPYLPL